MKKSTLFHSEMKHYGKKNRFGLLFLFLMCFFSRLDVRAQASSYDMTSEMGVYEETSADATPIAALLADSGISGVFDIGFDFYYEGVLYTQFKASSNGFISFNTGAQTLTGNNFSEANATSRPIIAPLWDDLDGRATGGSVAAYEVTGDAPNRVLTVEWRNWEWNYNSGNPVMSFQVKLYETSNAIEFVYRQESGAVNSGSASIGIGSATGSGLGSFLNITNIETLEYGSETSVTTISTKPLTGQILRFTPPTCIRPTGFVAENATTSSVDLSWNSDGGLFDVVWGAVGFSPEDGTGVAHNGVTSTSISATELDHATSYHLYVRQDCGDGDVSTWAGPFVFSTFQIPTALPYTEDFEVSPTGWEFANGTQVNRWVVGTATNNGGESAMYISNDPVNLTYAYTLSGTQVSHAFRNIEIPAGAQTIDLSFDWKAKGEGFTTTMYDYVTVWIVPGDYSLVAGTEITAAADRIQAGPRLNNNENFNTVNWVVNVEPFAGGEARLVFEWRNDSGGGNQPPGAIDNVSVSVTDCPPPAALTVDEVGPEYAVLSWESDGAAFDVTWGAQGFTPDESQDGMVENVPLPYTLEDLASATTYQYYVRQNCAGSTSIWVGPFTFTTLQFVATLPYSIDFETEPHNWSLSNGSQANKWVLGTAAHDGAENALYISNNNGETNAYVHTFSVVHAIREIEIPDGTTNVDISFDWRGAGELCCDYIRVWVVPITFMPTPGTQIVAANGKQIGGNFNMSSTFNTYNNVVDLSAYAGQTVRLVFEWKNDGGIGTLTPAGAIDNVSMKATTCSPPIALTADDVTTDTAILSWEGEGAGFDVAWGAPGFTPGEDQEGMVENVAVPYALEDLTSATGYQYYVRQNCGAGDVSIWAGPFAFTTMQVVATLPYSIDFETEPHNWTLSNGSQTNKWVLGTAAHDGAENALYISNNNGETNTYSHTLSVVHAFREIEIPDGTTDVDFSFDWHGTGETCCDYIRVWVVPTAFMPTPGTQIVAANGKQIGGNFNSSSTFNTYTSVVNLAAYAGQTVRLVFEWRNDGGGGVAPAGAIDNVSMNVTSCSPVTALAATSITANTAELSWTSDGSVFDIEYGPSGFALGTGTLIEEVTNPYVLQNLDPVTSYSYYVRQNCGAGDVSVWSSSFTFKTTQILGILPYSQDFEGDDHNWEFNNGTHANKWYVGEAVNNGGQRAMYISNDNGETNAYTTSSSVTHAYRDILMPDNAQNIALSFDWRCVGEGTGPNYYDYMRVWVVPTAFTPTNGSLITAAANRVQIGGYFNGNNQFLQANYSLDASEYAGQAVRLVFEFRSDVNGGVQPPAAIDNISIIEANCLPPTALNAENVDASSAELSWTSEGSTFDIQWGVEGFTIGEGTVIAEVANPYTLSGLNDAVAYQYYVRQNCGPEDASIWTGPFTFITSQIPVELPYFEGFETADHGWTLQNGSQFNKWYVGGGVDGMNTMYISNDGGATNTYATGSTSVTHSYRAIQIPEGTEEITVSFDWRAVGDSSDYLRAWIVDESINIVPGTGITAGTGKIAIGGNLNLASDFTLASHTINVSALAGQTVRLVFEWRNDYLGGVQTPAAIDNVNIELEDLGVNDPTLATFSYYPNPVVDLLNVSNNSEITALTVYNMLGQQVIAKSINAANGQVDMSNLAAGNYIVKVQTENVVKTIKVIKQ